MDRGDDSSVGSTGILDPVNQTGSPIQSDFLKIGTINGPASSGDIPPSSDSGVHSLGEQWENMSIYEYKFYRYGIGTERETVLR